MRTCSKRAVSVCRKASGSGSSHDTKSYLTANKQHVDPLPTDRDGDGETGDDANQTSDEASLPRRRVPFDEPLADDLATEGDGEGR